VFYAVSRCEYGTEPDLEPVHDHLLPIPYLIAIHNHCPIQFDVILVFEVWVVRRIFGLKRDEVSRSWRKLHNEELHNLYSSPSIIRIIKSRRMRWAGYVA
jgi:hypothetical protein